MSDKICEGIVISRPGYVCGYFCQDMLSLPSKCVIVYPSLAERGVISVPIGEKCVYAVSVDHLV